METVTIVEPRTDVVAVAGGTVVIETPAPIEVLEVEGGLLLVEGEASVEVVALEPDTVVLDPDPVATVIEIGIAGPQGPPGAPGAAGSAPQAYVHDQAVPSATWTIVHDLGYFPNVTVIDTLGRVVWGELSYPSNTAVIATFTAAFSGKAYLS